MYLTLYLWCFNIQNALLVIYELWLCDPQLFSAHPAQDSLPQITSE